MDPNALYIVYVTPDKHADEREWVLELDPIAAEDLEARLRTLESKGRVFQFSVVQVAATVADRDDFDEFIADLDDDQ